jgi:hypothetical protein
MGKMGGDSAPYTPDDFPMIIELRSGGRLGRGMPRPYDGGKQTGMLVRANRDEICPGLRIIIIRQPDGPAVVDGGIVE